MQVKLYNVRKNEKGMTKKQVAELLEITEEDYNAKEKGEAEFDQYEMYILSELFDKDMTELFSPRVR